MSGGNSAEREQFRVHFGQTTPNAQETLIHASIDECNNYGNYFSEENETFSHARTRPWMYYCEGSQCARRQRDCVTCSGELSDPVGRPHRVGQGHTHASTRTDTYTDTDTNGRH